MDRGIVNFFKDGMDLGQAFVAQELKYGTLYPFVQVQQACEISIFHPFVYPAYRPPLPEEEKMGDDAMPEHPGGEPFNEDTVQEIHNQRGGRGRGYDARGNLTSWISNGIRIYASNVDGEEQKGKADGPFLVNQRDIDRVDRAVREGAGWFTNTVQGATKAGAAKTSAFGAGMGAGLASVG